MAEFTRGDFLASNVFGYEMSIEHNNVIPVRIRTVKIFRAFPYYYLVMKIFSERLRELREEKGLSTVKLGEAIGTSGPTISRWETGVMAPSIVHLYNICKFFGVTAGYLIGLED